MMTNEDRKAEILRCIRAQTELGRAVVQGVFFDRTPGRPECMCPMSCVVATHDPQAVVLGTVGDPEFVETAAGAILEAPWGWVGGFIHGFDGKPDAGHPPTLADYRAGFGVGRDVADAVAGGMS